MGDLEIAPRYTLQLADHHRTMVLRLPRFVAVRGVLEPALIEPFPAAPPVVSSDGMRGKRLYNGCNGQMAQNRSLRPTRALALWGCP